MRQNITLSLGSEEEAPRRKQVLDELAAKYVTGGAGISGLLQRVADGRIHLFPERITDETQRQLDDLAARLGANKTEVLIYAIERLYREVVGGVEGTDRHRRPSPDLRA